MSVDAHEDEKTDPNAKLEAPLGPNAKAVPPQAPEDPDLHRSALNRSRSRPFGPEVPQDPSGIRSARLEEELRIVLKQVYVNKRTGLTDVALPYLEAMYEMFLGQFLYEKRSGVVAARHDALELAFLLMNNFVNTVICRKEFEFHSRKLLKEQINYSCMMGNRLRAKMTAGGPLDPFGPRANKE